MVFNETSTYINFNETRPLNTFAVKDEIWLNPKSLKRVKELP